MIHYVTKLLKTAHFFLYEHAWLNYSTQYERQYDGKYFVYTKVPKKVFAGGLPLEMGEEDLYKLFSSFGPVDNVKLVKGTNGCSKGYAFITYATQMLADLVLTEHSDENFFNSKNINVGPAMKKLTLVLTRSQIAQLIKLSNEWNSPLLSFSQPVLIGPVYLFSSVIQAWKSDRSDRIGLKLINFFLENSVRSDAIFYDSICRPD